MKEHFLDFERPLAEIIEKIEALQAASNEDPELLGQIEKLDPVSILFTNAPR